MTIISECTFANFDLIKSKDVVTDNSSIGKANECKFTLPVFAYPTDIADTWRNDFTSSLLSLSNRYSAPKIFLEKESSCDNWTEITQLTDDTYGTYFPIASIDGWIGYKVQWHLVNSINGLGCYRLRQEYTDLTDSSTKISYSYKYNLRLFSEVIADKTTKITYTVNGGLLGDPKDDKNKINYQGITWEREVRLPQSFFGFESSEFAREFTRYLDGGQVHILDDQVETILFNARRLPYSLHRELKTIALQSDIILMSDYNLDNPSTIAGVPYDHKRVNCSSSYEPTWNTNNTYAGVNLTFEPYYQNLRRKRC